MVNVLDIRAYAGSGQGASSQQECDRAEQADDHARPERAALTGAEDAHTDSH